MLGLSGACVAPVKNSESPKTAATAASAPAKPTVAAAVPLEPVEGELSPESSGAIGPFDSHILAMATSENTVAISVADASSVRLYDARTGQPAGELPSHAGSVLGMKFSRDGKHLSAINRKQDEVYVWDLKAQTPARTVRAPNKVWGAIPLNGGTQVALAGDQGLLAIASVETGQVVRSIPVPEKATIFGLGLSSSGRWLSAVLEGRSMIVVDLEHVDALRRADADKKMYLSATEFSPDDQFVLARGSSFAPPKTVVVGAHPEGQEPGATGSTAACGAALIPTGLIGYAICAAIVNAKNSDPTESNTGPATGLAKRRSSDEHPTVDVAGMSGELMLWQLSVPHPIVVKAFGRTFEQIAWSKDASKVALVTISVQDGEMVKRVLTYQRSQISARSSALPSPMGSITLGRAGHLSMGVISSDEGTLFMERSQPAGPAPAKPKYTVERWKIPALQTEVASTPRVP